MKPMDLPLPAPAGPGGPVPMPLQRVPHGQPLISLAGAGVRFGAVQALQDITLQLKAGDRMALVGANGSGKTTLLRLLNGLLPHEGRRTLHMARPAGVAGAAGGPGRRPVSAMVFQRPFLLHLSVRQNLRLALWLARVPRAEHEARLHAALARVGLEAVLQRPARALSGGQQQRLALARAWAVRPDVLFLDEPTASLDPSAKREVETLIDEFGRDGMTLVMSSHNLGQVKRLANRVVYLDMGHLRADLPVDDFFNRDALPEAAVQFLKGELPWQ